MRIMMCVIDSVVVYKMVDYVSKLFPDAEYYIISLIERLRWRSYLTRMYRFAAERTLMRAQDNAERILRKNSIEKIHKEIIHRRWRDFLEKYISEKGIDLIAITSRSRVDIRDIGSTARYVLKESKIPVLLYMPRAEIIPIGREIHILVVGDVDLPEKIVGELEKNYKVIIHKAEITELKYDQLSRYDLVVTDPDTLLRGKLYMKIWQPIISVPLRRR